MAPPSRAACSFLREFVRLRSGVALDGDKDLSIEVNLASLLRDLVLASLDDLAAQLRAGPASPLANLVVDRILNHETLFFRDPALFDALRRILLPQLLPSRTPARPVRFWSAACSSGQEPFSLALLLRTHYPGAPATILASDLSSEMVARAEQASYSTLEINRGLPAPILTTSFRREGARWILDPAVRSLVEFRRINLVDPWPPLPPIDVLLLRNVLLYMADGTRRAILRRAAAALAPGGVLILGSAETILPEGEAWETVRVGEALAFRPLEASVRRPSP